MVAAALAAGDRAAAVADSGILILNRGSNDSQMENMICSR
jgi:hypothetical protein